MTARVRERHWEAAAKWINREPTPVECRMSEADWGRSEIARLASLLAETEAAALERAARIASEVAHEYEGDWSSGEFNFAADVARKIREASGFDGRLCPSCSGTGRALIEADE